MLKINHILFPTDFSENAENALPFALEVAKHSGAKLTLYHVIEAPSYVTHNSEDLPKTHTEKARTLIEQIKQDIFKDDRYKHLHVNAVLQNGNVVSGILEESSNQDVDLLVMGTKGKSKMDRILYGSIASHIIMESKVPVLAVPQNSHRTRFDPITFATDYRKGDWMALKQTIGWAEAFESDLNVLHVAEDKDMQSEIKFRGFKDLVEEKASIKPVHFDLVIQKKFFTGIADYLTDHPVGLLVLVRYDKGRIESLISKNHTKELSYYTKVPLLVLIGEEAPMNV